MASLEHLIGNHKLETEFFSGHVKHTTYHSDASRGERPLKVVKTWRRDRELGRGGSGTVFLEWSEKEEPRAVKDIAKDKNSRIAIDYRRELMAMAVLAKHDALFVQFFGWYESNHYIHIAMEYISQGHLRNYLEWERSESEAKAVTRQLLEGLVAIHQEGFAHRDLKPENIFVISDSPIWVKIGDFGLAKLARTGTAFRTRGGTMNYVAPEVEIDPSTETSEYTNAVDIWSIGCITHELLTQVLPFRGIRVLMLYCSGLEFPRISMLSKNISQKGIEFVESTLAYPPERRIAAKEALDSEWLRPESRGAAGLKTGESPTTTRPIESGSYSCEYPSTNTATKSPRSLYSTDAAPASEPEIATPLIGPTQPGTPVATPHSAPQPTTGAPQAATLPSVSSEQISQEQRLGKARLPLIPMAATAAPGFGPPLIIGRDKAVTPEPVDIDTPRGADAPHGHQSPQGVAGHTGEGDVRSSSITWARDVLQRHSMSRPGGNGAGSFFGSDSASTHTVADVGPGPGSVPPMPQQHKPAKTLPSEIPAALNRTKLPWRSGGEERRRGADQRTSLETPRLSPRAAIYPGSDGRRRPVWWSVTKDLKSENSVD